MRAIRVARPPLRVGVSVGVGRVTAALSTGSGADRGEPSWVHALESPPGTPGWGDELTHALAVMCSAMSAPRCGLHVVLLPPLVEVKRVELPRMRDGELRRVLARDAERYFLHAREPQVVGIQRIGRSRRSPAPVLATAAAASVVERVFEAAGRNGCTVLSLTPAHFAWALARGTRGKRTSGSELVEVWSENGAEVLVLERGHLTLVRRLRQVEPTASPAELLDHVGTVHRVIEPEAVAARLAARADGPEMLPEREYRRREAASARRVGRLLGCAAACLLLAAGVELWGRQRALEALVARRAALQSSVERVMTVREALGGLERRVAALDAAESRGSRWSTVLATVAERLPDDAHLFELRGAGDSLALAGQGGRAAAVFEALQQGDGVIGVRATAPIRQEARDSGPPVERFTLAARLGAGGPPGAGP